MTSDVCLGLIGPGTWGINYIKTIEKIQGIRLKKVACQNPNNKKNDLLKKYSITSDWHEISRSKDIDGVIITSPPSTHFDIAKDVIKNKKPLIIEKPLTLSSVDAQILYDLAFKNKINVKVNHVYLYHPLYRFLKDSVRDISSLKSIYAISGNYGPFREDISPLWDWGPHDIAMRIDFMKEMPIEIEAKFIKNKNLSNPNIFNTSVTLTFKKNKYAELNFGNLMELKRRYFQLNYEHSSFIFDPINFNKIKIKNKINSINNQIKESSRLLNNNYSPLEILVQEFTDDIRNSRFEMYDLELAKKVIIIIELIERKLNKINI